MMGGEAPAMCAIRTRFDLVLLPYADGRLCRCMQHVCVMSCSTHVRTGSFWVLVYTTLSACRSQSLYLGEAERDDKFQVVPPWSGRR